MAKSKIVLLGLFSVLVSVVLCLAALEPSHLPTASEELQPGVTLVVCGNIVVAEIERYVLPNDAGVSMTATISYEHADGNMYQTLLKPDPVALIALVKTKMPSNTPRLSLVHTDRPPREWDTTARPFGN